MSIYFNKRNINTNNYDDLKVINKPLFENNVNLYGKDYKNGLHPNSLGYDIIAKTLKDWLTPWRVFLF